MDPSVKDKLLKAFSGGASKLGDAAILAQVPYHEATTALSGLLADGIVVYDGPANIRVAGAQ